MSKSAPRPRRRRGWKSWLRSFFVAPRASGGWPQRLRLESLEPRWVRSSFAVTDNSDNAADVNSLRYAIDNLAVGTTASANTITIASTLTGGQTITLAGQLDINEGVTITGPGASTVAISGNNASGVFKVESGIDASIAGLTITKGIAAAGGGVENLGSLSIANCTISGNSATQASSGGGGGGLYNGGGSLSISNCTISGNSGALGVSGGGLYNGSGSLSIANSTISGNSASWGGGIYNWSGSVSISNSTTLSGNSATWGGAFYNGSGSVSITNSTISGNSAASGGGAVYSEGGSVSLANSTINGNSAIWGGALDNTKGSLSIANSTISANSAALDGGGIYDGSGLLSITGNSTLESNTAANGGGIYNNGTLSIANSTISSNSAASDGGGIYDGSGLLSITNNSTLESNTAANGGGIYNNGTLSIANSTLSGNSAASSGGGGGGAVYNSSGSLSIDNCTISGNHGAWGGALFSFGSASITNSTISSNSATAAGGGAVYNSENSLLITNSTLNDNSAASAGGALENGYGSTTLTNSTFSGNSAAGNGGGIYGYTGSLSIANCTISGNSAVTGGGGVGNATGTLSIANSIISGNTVSGNAWGGGIDDDSGSLTIDNCTISGNSAISGGGVGNATGTLSITNSALQGNTAESGGGGVYNNNGSVSVANSTFSGNLSVTGGAVYNGGNSLTIANCTISGNTSTNDGGGVNNKATMTLQNSIVSVNSAPTDTDAAGGFTDLGNNLLGTALDTGSPPASDVFTDTPGLAALANYGGTTETMALLPGSPALGAGTALGGGIATTDQRGVNRPTTGLIDIGAYQSQGFTLALAGGASPQTVLAGTGFTNPLAVTVTANGLGGAVNGGVITFAANPGFNGQSATLSGARITISGGAASVTATANNLAGTYTVSASPGKTSGAVNFSLTNQGGSVTGTVFDDLNGNGRQDAGEAGLAGITVYLDLNHSGQFVSGDPSDVTDINGDYTIGNVTLGSYTIREQTVPASTNLTAPPGGSASVNLTAGSLTASVNFGQIQTSVVLGVAAQPNLYSNNTSDAGLSYVKSLYSALLGRSPGLAESEYWVGILDSLGGATAAVARWVVAADIWNAPEHRSDEVAAYYQTLLGRSASADPNSIFWVHELEAGVGELAIVQDIMSSPEYQNKTANNNTLFVQNLLGVLGVRGTNTVTINGSPINLLSGLNGGALARSQAVGDAVLSDQSLQSITGSMYQAYLQRPVNAATDLLYWQEQIRAGGVQNVGIALLSSQEYFEKIEANL